MMPRPLRDMTVLITGASSGIGAALARTLHASGCRLVLSARREDLLVALNTELGGTHLIVPADVGDPAACARLIDAAYSALGRLDTLVCNAGYGDMRTVLESDPASVRRMFDVNLLGTTECVRAAVPRMLAQAPVAGFRGQVMIVSSGAARRGVPMLGVYSATKAAQLSVAEALRVELKGSGVAVTSVHPVTTKTAFFDVAAAHGGREVDFKVPKLASQTAGQVAGAMARAIARPRREVWPLRPSRWALSFTTLFPSIGDYVMARARGPDRPKSPR